MRDITRTDLDPELDPVTEAVTPVEEAAEVSDELSMEDEEEAGPSATGEVEDEEVEMTEDPAEHPAEVDPGLDESMEEPLAERRGIRRQAADTTTAAEETEEEGAAARASSRLSGSSGSRLSATRRVKKKSRFAKAKEIVWPKHASDSEEINVITVPVETDMDLPKHRSPFTVGLDLKLSRQSTLPAGRVVKLPTGMKFKLPPGVIGKVDARNGGNLNGILIHSTIIDEKFTDELTVAAQNTTSKDRVLSAETRLAQFTVLPYVEATFKLATNVAKKCI